MDDREKNALLAWVQAAKKVAAIRAHDEREVEQQQYFGGMASAYQDVENMLVKSMRRKPKPPEPGKLEWHKGDHVWQEHDGYPRHQHSINGALTIAPNDTGVHFAGGPPFERAGHRG